MATKLKNESNSRYMENYPLWSIAVSDLVPLGTYIIAGTIIYHFGLFWFLASLIYFAILEITFYSKACVYCYYYGKWCFSGKGKVAALLFKKKQPRKFCERKVNFVTMLPDLLLIFVPVILGIVLLIQEFAWWIFVLIAMDLALTFWGNALVRGKLACPHCKQGQICCPTRDMFGGIKKIR